MNLTGLKAGSRLGRYRVEALLAAGGMGEVYRATDLTLGRPVALKVIPREATAEQDRLQRFATEARAASSLAHPAIVTVYDAGQAVPGESSDGAPVHYLAMELIVHTHPNCCRQPSFQDRKTSNSLGMPVVILTSRSVVFVSPAGGQDKEFLRSAWTARDRGAALCTPSHSARAELAVARSD